MLAIDTMGIGLILLILHLLLLPSKLTAATRKPTEPSEPSNAGIIPSQLYIHESWWGRESYITSTMQILAQ